jgi:hypothetical protein
LLDTDVPEVVDCVVPDVPEVVDCVVPDVPEVVDCVVTVDTRADSLVVVAAAIATIDRNIRTIGIDFIVELCFVNLPFIRCEQIN